MRCACQQLQCVELYPQWGAAPRGRQHGSQTRCRSFRQGASIIILAAPRDPPRFCRRLRALNPSGPKPLLPREATPNNITPPRRRRRRRLPRRRRRRLCRRLCRRRRPPRRPPPPPPVACPRITAAPPHINTLAFRVRTRNLRPPPAEAQSREPSPQRRGPHAAPTIHTLPGGSVPRPSHQSALATAHPRCPAASKLPLRL